MIELDGPMPAWESGQHVAITGQTGSGKTTALRSLIEHRPTTGLIVFDTKMDPAFSDAGTVIDHPEFEREWSNDRVDEHPVLVFRSARYLEPDALDDILMRCHETLRNVTLLLDEGYMFHDRGQAGPGLMALLTRGRSRGQTVMIGSQRPVWVSRFCFTEATHILFMRLRHPDDRKTVALSAGFPELSETVFPKFQGVWIHPDGKSSFTVVKEDSVQSPEMVPEKSIRFL